MEMPIAGHLIKGDNAAFTPVASSHMHAANVGGNTQHINAKVKVNTSGKSCHLQLTNSIYSIGYSPINVKKLQAMLHHYPLKEVGHDLVMGFREGFPLCYHGPRVPTDSNNLVSAKQNHDILQQKINKEIEAGRVAGPFLHRPIPTLRVSPLGLVPKQSGDYRVIHHLSYPNETSVNDFIDPHYCTVQYSSIDDAVHMIQELGRGALLGKTDIKSAFRLLPVYPGDFDLLGFKMDGKFYFDKCLPMGASISCSLFEKISSALHWIVEQKSVGGLSALLHYLDDFLFGGKAQSNECGELMQSFHEVCSDLGVPLADEKTEGPSSTICFLGIEFDSNKMEMRLPVKKVSDLQVKLREILSKKKVTLKSLQSLIGSLNFACQVVRPGRAFCRRLINATKGIQKSHHHIRVNSEMQADITAWLTFLETYNGVTVMPDKFWVDNESLQFFTDSAGGAGRGFGIYFQGQWAYGTWPNTQPWQSLLPNITFLELFPVVTALSTWGSSLQNRKLLFHIDNEAVVTIINKNSSKCFYTMSLVRRLVLFTLKYNIILRAEHIKGMDNSIADAISRCQWKRFRQLAPQADLQPTVLPASIWYL